MSEPFSDERTHVYQYIRIRIPYREIQSSRFGQQSLGKGLVLDSPSQSFAISESSPNT